MQFYFLNKIKFLNFQRLTYKPYRLCKNDFFIFIGLVLFSFLVYISTMFTNLAPGDSGELVTAAFNKAVSHPPGFPLFSIFANIFTFLPIGNIAFRVNLFSVVCGALTVGILYIICIKLLSINTRVTFWNQTLPSIGASISFAFSRIFWEQNLVAEVYAFNILLISLLILVFILWYETLYQNVGKRPLDINFPLFLLLFFVMGISLTNHQFPLFFIITICLYLPFILFSYFQITKEEYQTIKRDQKIFLTFFVILVFISIGFLYITLFQPYILFPKYGIGNRLLYSEHVPFIFCSILMPILFCIEYLGLVYIKHIKYFICLLNLFLLFSLPMILGVYSFCFSLIILIYNLYYLVYSEKNKSILDSLVCYFLGSVAFFLLGFSVYFYLLWRGKAIASMNVNTVLFSWGDISSSDVLFNHILRKQYSDGGSGLNDLFSQLFAILKLTLKQMSFIHLFLALVGIYYFWKKSYLWCSYFLLTLLVMIFSLVCFINFETDPRTFAIQSVFFIPVFFIEAIFLAFGYKWIIKFLIKKEV